MVKLNIQRIIIDGSISLKLRNKLLKVCLIRVKVNYSISMILGKDIKELRKLVFFCGINSVNVFIEYK